MSSRSKFERWLVQMAASLVSVLFILSSGALADEPAANARPASGQATPQEQTQHEQKTDLQSLMADDRQWPMAAKNYANTRFGKLDQINAGNVNQLQLAWSF